ncbi:MAG: hypothetical protein NVSMB25_09880 [Thermoleophilaceae bacterium]
MAALARDQPQIAGVTQSGAIEVEHPLRVPERLDHHDRAVEVAGPDKTAADRVLEVTAQAWPHIAGHLDTLLGRNPELLDRAAVSVVDARRHFACNYRRAAAGGSPLAWNGSWNALPRHGRRSVRRELVLARSSAAAQGAAAWRDYEEA